MGYEKGLAKYFTFGLKEIWIKEFFENENYIYCNNLGPIQIKSLLNYLKDFNLIDNKMNKTKIYFNLLKISKFSNLSLWSILWINLCINSSLFQFWTNCLCSKYNKNDLLNMLNPKFSLRTRINSINSLISTLEQTPIGKELKQGIVIKEKRERIVIKEGNPDIPSEVVLYNLFRFAEETNIYNFSIKEIENNSFSPQKIFCLSTEKTENLLRSLWNIDFYDVEYTQNSLKIKLNQKYSSLDVLKYIGERYEV